MKLFLAFLTLGVGSGYGQDFLRQAFPGGATRVDLESDGIFSSDIKVIDSTFRFQQERGKHRFNFEVGTIQHEVEYSPAPGTFTRDARRDEEAFDVALGYRYDLRSNLRLNFNASYSDGFTDHRSLWIDEFYLQSFEFFPSYEAPDPKSFAFSTGFEWDLSARHTLVGTLGFSQATIVAGFSVDPVTFSDVVISDDVLDTYSGSLRLESQVNSKVTTQQTLLLSETEDRRLRVQLRSDWAVSLHDQVTLRLQVGAAREDPVFEAFYGGVNLVYEVTPQWQFDLGYRLYSDTGEVTASNFNTAAPGVDNTELSIGALWRIGDTSIRASVSMFESDFNEITNPENLVFANLFGDRDFTAARLAITHTF